MKGILKMINRKELFKKYNLKTWKQSKFQIFLSITSIAIAVAILVSLKLIFSLNDSWSLVNSKSINDGDINIGTTNFSISDKQLNDLNKLTSDGKIKYDTTYKMEDKFTNDQITSLVQVKAIDSNYSYINKKISSYLKKLGNRKVLLNRAAADKFQLKKGDIISLELSGFSNSNSKFTVADVVESTDVLDESVLGVIILDKSDFQSDGIVKENLATNVNVVVDKTSNLADIKNKLGKIFGSGVHMTTYEDVIEANRGIEDKETNAAGFIQMLVIIITGIGICFTTLLLILKRKKDYVLLSIYGMKEDMLRDLILYETFKICVYGISIGIFLSIIITGAIEKNILMEMDILTIIKASILPVIMTIIFIIGQTMIFTILPITISKQIKPNSILRQEVQKTFYTKDYGDPIFKMILLMIVWFSIYIGSIKTGAMYISIMIILIMVLYGIALGTIYLVVKIKTKRGKYVLLAVRNIRRQQNRFTVCIVALTMTIIFCGLMINIGQSILPSIIDQIGGDLGYTLSVNTNFNEENIKNTEKVLGNNKLVKKYIKTINTPGRFKIIQGKNLKDFIKDQNFTPDNETYVKNLLNNDIKLEAIDISKDMLSYKTAEGRWFSSKDVNKNYVVLGEKFQHWGININDEIELNLQGTIYKFKVIGICTTSNFRDNSGIYIDINAIKNNTSIGESNSKINYLIENGSGNEKQLYLGLTKELKNSLVTDEREVFNELNKYLDQLTYVFIYIGFISIFSALCLVGNVLMIINYERLNEFVILSVVGAKNRDIRRISIIEGIIIGGISGIAGSLICELLGYIVVTGEFSGKYTVNLKIDAIMTVVAVMLTIITSLIVINNLKIEKYTELLRND
ncbi:FtsX-like permease family protein [Clostridium akagii]|uniref:FtsX-like permease family protein n=1 Tax=Clostridium akagii TaxID=91623 RepID=UPI00047CC229|nr:FtsX-like permease family protein [Clostridium akagii]